MDNDALNLSLKNIHNVKAYLVTFMESSFVKANFDLLQLSVELLEKTEELLANRMV